MSELCEISLEMAQDLGLVPKPDIKVNITRKDPHFLHKGYNVTHSSDHQAIVDKYCFDKKLLLCRFPREQVVAAAWQLQEGL